MIYLFYKIYKNGRIYVILSGYLLRILHHLFILLLIMLAIIPVRPGFCGKATVAIEAEQTNHWTRYYH